VQQRGEKLAALSQMDAGVRVRDSKSRRIHKSKLWATGRRREFEKPEWEPVTCPVRVRDVVSYSHQPKINSSQAQVGQ
jgi:hypothetical protein